MRVQTAPAALAVRARQLPIFVGLTTTAICAGAGAATAERLHSSGSAEEPATTGRGPAIRAFAGDDATRLVVAPLLIAGRAASSGAGLGWIAGALAAAGKSGVIASDGGTGDFHGSVEASSSAGGESDRPRDDPASLGAWRGLGEGRRRPRRSPWACKTADGSRPKPGQASEADRPCLASARAGSATAPGSTAAATLAPPAAGGCASAGRDGAARARVAAANGFCTTADGVGTGRGLMTAALAICFGSTGFAGTDGVACATFAARPRPDPSQPMAYATAAAGRAPGRRRTRATGDGVGWTTAAAASCPTVAAAGADTISPDLTASGRPAPGPRRSR